MAKAVVLVDDRRVKTWNFPSPLTQIICLLPASLHGWRNSQTTPCPIHALIGIQTQLFCLGLPLIPSFEFLSNKTNDADVRSRSQKAWHRFQLVLIGWQWMGRRCRSDIIYPSPLLTCTLWPRITGRTSQESVTVMLVWHLYLFFFFVFFYNLRCPSNVPNVRYLILSDTVASHACTQYFVFSNARIQHDLNNTAPSPALSNQSSQPPSSINGSPESPQKNFTAQFRKPRASIDELL